jgi:luciferase family oxidoreductase group 1
VITFAVPRLSVLDQSPVPLGSTPAEALHETVALAQAVERLGYHRYWLAEHHNTASLAGTAPEVLAAHVASRTTTIRIGSGGVLLPYYRPLKVAETFRVLHALFPGRIDLGLGRAAGADEAAADRLRHEPEALSDEHYPANVAELVALVNQPSEAEHAIGEVRAMPTGEGAPEVWILGSSSYGAGLAAGLGLRFCFAHFVSPAFGAQTVAGYRRRFRHSPQCPTPVAALGVSVICADTDAEAERLAVSSEVWRLRPEGAGRGPLLSVEEAEAQRMSGVERMRMAQDRPKRVVGAPDRVRASLLTMAADYDVDELVVLTVCHDPAARRRSYELLAEAFALP